MQCISSGVGAQCLDLGVILPILGTCSHGYRCFSPMECLPWTRTEELCSSWSWESQPRCWSECNRLRTPRSSIRFSRALGCFLRIFADFCTHVHVFMDRFRCWLRGGERPAPTRRCYSCFDSVLGTPSGGCRGHRGRRALAAGGQQAPAMRGFQGFGGLNV